MGVGVGVGEGVMVGVGVLVAVGTAVCVGVTEGVALTAGVLAIATGDVAGAVALLQAASHTKLIRSQIGNCFTPCCQIMGKF